MSKKAWNLQPQECSGTYTFSGNIYVTRGVQEELSEQEIMQIILDVKLHVEQNGNADYLQIFKNNSGKKIYVIDNLNTEMKAREKRGFVKENDYFTILFSYEY